MSQVQPPGLFSKSYFITIFQSPAYRHQQKTSPSISRPLFPSERTLQTEPALGWRSVGSRTPLPATPGTPALASPRLSARPAARARWRRGQGRKAVSVGFINNKVNALLLDHWKSRAPTVSAAPSMERKARPRTRARPGPGPTDKGAAPEIVRRCVLAYVSGVRDPQAVMKNANIFTSLLASLQTDQLLRKAPRQG